jgi:hypothetical protein
LGGGAKVAPFCGTFHGVLATTPFQADLESAGSGSAGRPCCVPPVFGKFGIQYVRPPVVAGCNGVSVDYVELGYQSPDPTQEERFEIIPTTQLAAIDSVVRVVSVRLDELRKCIHGRVHEPDRLIGRFFIAAVNVSVRRE